ncbi:hypothetical protein EDEG_02858 [Edhazardia aedis USNM 41457]|uniref:SLC41A/MgtE integral membrane domain-containing protein n=1 Tax=Edhazardia aedis (strain USNM 41457) TaxID=1003232 RepID=J9DN01_EDHAE|nr:hypothetical protein EDEG_02858 [Edhazardia aedis USNM 41457]|eukprot:EJW02737.1 hypothetical protein EDEG_02858 [Edhazardia aedis USNM 41457]
MQLRKNIDLNMIVQSIPSLIISLIGLTLSGRKLDIEQMQEFANKFPILLLSNCMLTFKGNAELIFAMHLSSFSQIKNLNSMHYIRYAFDNSCLVLAQSIVIGLSVGILGFARNVILNVYDIQFLSHIAFICLFSAFLSSLAIITMLIPSVLIAVRIGANPDNIVLPVISSFGDFLDILILIYSIKKFQYMDTIYSNLWTISILLLLPILVYISVASEYRVPIQSFYILVITYVLSTTSSYMVQFLSKKHLLLASSTPIFCGLTGSITYIYLNKRITSMQNLTPHNRKRSYLTLIFTSIIITCITIGMLPLIGIHTKKTFGMLFIFGFIVSVCFLMRIVEVILKFYTEDATNVGVVSLPLITSISDFIGSLILIFASITVYGYR